MRSISIVGFALLPVLSLNADEFVQGDIKIQLPVRMKKTTSGLILASGFNDGGTKMYDLVDAKGKGFKIFIDHRLRAQDTRGMIFLNDYPGSSNSVRILNQELFKQKVLYSSEDVRKYLSQELNISTNSNNRIEPGAAANGEDTRKVPSVEKPKAP